MTARFRNAAIFGLNDRTLQDRYLPGLGYILWRPVWCMSKARNREIARSLQTVNERFERFRNAAIAPHGAPQKKAGFYPGFQ